MFINKGEIWVKKSVPPKWDWLVCAGMAGFDELEVADQ